MLAELLHDELCTYPGRGGVAVGPRHGRRSLFVPLVLRTATVASCRSLSTVATFGTARDVTVDELSIESFFPADERPPRPPLAARRWDRARPGVTAG